MKYVLLFIIFALFLIPTFGQVSKTEPKGLDKVVKKEGWNIPRIREEELFSNQVTNIENIPVTVKGYKLKKGVDFQLDYYFLGENNTLTTFVKIVEVKAVGSFSIQNKVFAYSANCVPFGFSENGSKAYVGVMISIYYFDEDGDGKFETRYIANKLPNIIPNWITNPKIKSHSSQKY